MDGDGQAGEPTLLEAAGDRRTGYMPRGPVETVLGFSQALLRRDAAAGAAYFSPQARLLTPDGTELGGRSSISELLEQLVAPDHELEIRTGRVLRADSVALCQQYWTRRSRRVEVERFEKTSTAQLVLQHHDDGWLITIAAPWG